MDSAADLLRPGAGRAGALFTDATVLQRMVEVEAAWLAALVTHGVAPRDAADDLAGLVNDADIDALASGAEAAGNPVVGVVALLRARVGDRAPAAATWLHRGLTSQDVLDTALVCCAGEVLDHLAGLLRSQLETGSELARRHRGTPQVGRTLTQHAVPITFGGTVAGWLKGLLDAAAGVERARWMLPGQFGGAAGTLSALTELSVRAGVPAAPPQVVASASAAVGLNAAPPWHTARGPITRIGDALVGCTDAWGHLANDVLTLSRPEIGELAEPVAAGRGGSSTMPQKVNPVLSVLLRRAALAAPTLGAQLHLAAANSTDQRAAGAWQLEWPTLRTLAQQAVVAASQASELLEGLQVDTARMRTTLDAAADDVLAERRSLDAVLDGGNVGGPDSYLGASAAIVDAVLDRVQQFLDRPVLLIDEEQK